MSVKTVRTKRRNRVVKGCVAVCSEGHRRASAEVVAEMESQGMTEPRSPLSFVKSDHAGVEVDMYIAFVREVVSAARQGNFDFKVTCKVRKSGKREIMLHAEETLKFKFVLRPHELGLQPQVAAA